MSPATGTTLLVSSSDGGVPAQDNNLLDVDQSVVKSVSEGELGVEQEINNKDTQTTSSAVGVVQINNATATLEVRSGEW